MQTQFYILALVVLFGSCNTKTEKSQTYPRPVKVAKALHPGYIVKDYAGMVRATNYANLAFPISGQVVELQIIEGQKVKKGELIARIDPRDLLLQISSNKAAYETALAVLERNKRLLKKQAISEQEYEVSMANFQKSKSAYELSQNNLKDCKLFAPFDGSIEKRHIENYQRINAGESIVLLVDTKQIEVQLALPDNALPLLQNSNQFSVQFENSKGKWYKAKIKEYLDASPNGTGIPVTLLIDDDEFNRIKTNIKPGFTCSVRFKIELTENQKSIFSVPITALFVDNQSPQKYIWVINDAMQVERRSIEAISASGENILIKADLKNGEQVVSAGVYQLTPGESVQILP